jgi:tetratricopeptide (TPR) repeat protein
VTRKKIVIKDKDKKKDDLDPMKDQFIQRSASVFNWLVDRRKPLGVGAIMLLVAIIAGIAVSSILNSRRAEAASLLEKGFEAELAPVVPTADRPKDLAKTNPDLVLFETRKARAEETRKRFEKAAADLSGKTTGAIAQLGLAAADADLGAYDKAAAEYQAFLDGAGEGASWLRANALDGLGAVLEAQGKLDEARKSYKELGELNAGDASMFGKVHEARIASAKGDNDGAKKLLTDVIASAKERNRISASNVPFVEARELLLSIDPTADVPSLPANDLGSMDPEMLQRYIQALQAQQQQQQAGGAEEP